MAKSLERRPDLEAKLTAPLPSNGSSILAEFDRVRAQGSGGYLSTDALVEQSLHPNRALDVDSLVRRRVEEQTETIADRSQTQ